MEKLLIFSFLVLCAVVYAVDREGEAGGVKVKVLGQSGKLLIRKKTQEEKNAIVIEMDEIKEKDANEDEVGKTGSKKHVFNTFANQAFTFSPLVDTMYKNLSTKNFNFTSYIASTGATLFVDVFIFTQSGVFSFGDEETSVKNGTIKWNIKIDNWAFCNGTANGCSKGAKSEYGSFLDFRVCIKSKSKPVSRTARKVKTQGKKAMARFDVGDGANLELASGYMANGVDELMPSGFPKFETIGARNCYVFRFKKFNGSVIYDPTLEFSADDDTNGVTCLSSISLVSMLLVALIGFFA